MQVDHVLPELLVSQPTYLANAQAPFGLPVSLDLKSFENWLPSCSRGNGQSARTCSNQRFWARSSFGPGEVHTRIHSQR